ncbi:CsbD family protein [Streptomyces sp. NPDC048277]|uniref:CsbD family protein n=1 Tax=Streptomyces sp. NPDC048277 TaxID=3155027 RepID=UPI0033F31514
MRLARRVESDPALPGDGATPGVLALVAMTSVVERVKTILVARAHLSADTAYERLVADRVEEMGRAKEAVGRTVGNERMTAEGQAEKPKDVFTHRKC